MSGRASGGLKLFSQELDAATVAEVLRWEHHPQLGRIVSNLRSHTNRKAFFDTFAEAMVARQITQHGCEIRFEVPTPLGRQADFEVRCSEDDASRFYLHVKRLDTNRPPHNPRRVLAASSRLRVLERIARPYVIQVRWHEEANEDEMQNLVTQASAFLKQARVGDEMKAYSDDGREIGGVRVIAPWQGTHVNVTIGLPSGFVDHAPRFRRLMHRASQQFMPRATNVILICSDHEDDALEFETALLGSHIERWNAYPPRGRRVAHGRAADGFWHGSKFSESRFAVWCCCRPATGELECRLWMRGEAAERDPARQAIVRVFG